MQQWLAWSSAELSLHGIDVSMWTVKGSQLCKMERDEFTSRCPPFVGDILWEHLDMLKKGVALCSPSALTSKGDEDLAPILPLPL